jgi:putative SOS response-associated peptidase YedK
MCGRLVRDLDADAELAALFEIGEANIVPRFNIAPTQLDLFVRGEAGGRRLVSSRWGLIPAWAKDRSVGGKMFNARAETLAERPAYRGLLARHRCVVPASGFYEWRPSPADKSKQPLYLHRTDGKPLALAGLWTTWQDPDRGESVTSHTIITTSANRFMAPIHNRMPVVLDEDGMTAWLDPDEADAGAVLPLLGPCPDDVLTAYPVAPLVNNVRNDGPELIAPIG